MNKSKIGIVGGSGYIGSMLAEYLSDRYKVKILDKSPYPKTLKNKNLTD